MGVGSRPRGATRGLGSFLGEVEVEVEVHLLGVEAFGVEDPPHIEAIESPLLHLLHEGFDEFELGRQLRLLVLGLDPGSRNEVWDAVRELSWDGTDVLLTTQYLDEADHLAALIVIIDGGRVIAQGTPDELKSRVGADIVELHTADVPAMQRAAEVLASLGAAEPVTDPSTRRASIAAPGGAKLLPVVVRALDDAAVAVEDISLRRPTLDEVFLALTGHTTSSVGNDTDTDPTGPNPKEDAAA